MPCWPVSHQDGRYQVTDSDGVLYPITLAHAPVEVLNPGWYPVGLQTGLLPYHLLELRNDGPPEMEAVWYLSDMLDFVANTPRHFSPEQAELVVAHLSPLLRDLHDITLCAPWPEVAASSHAFDGIHAKFIRELIGFVVETALSPPDVVAAQRLDGVSAQYTANEIKLSASLLRHSLDVVPPEAARDALMVASPFDATLLTAQERFEPGDGPTSQVHRFCDPTGQVVFYMLFRQDGAQALYIPMMNTVFAGQDGFSGSEVMTTLLSHYATHTDRLAPPKPCIPEPYIPEPPLPEAVPVPAQEAGPVGQTIAEPPASWWKRLSGLGTP